jgi:hypothetical protein
MKVFGYKKNSKFINLPLFFFLLYLLATVVYMAWYGIRYSINININTHFFTDEILRTLQLPPLE